MSLQDKIFDIEAALDGTPERDAFDHVVTRLAELERSNESMSAAIQAARAGFAAFAAIVGVDVVLKERE